MSVELIWNTVFILFQFNSLKTYFAILCALSTLQDFTFYLVTFHTIRNLVCLYIIMSASEYFVYCLKSHFVCHVNCTIVAGRLDP